MTTTTADAGAPRRPGILWAFMAGVVLVAFAALAGVRALVRPSSSAAGDLGARIERIEERLAALEAQPRSSGPRFVLDPSRTVDRAGLDEAVAALSREVADLRAHVGPGEPEPAGPSPLEQASSQDAGQRRKAIKRLRDLAKKDPEAARALRRLLADADAGVRKDAVDALRKAGDPGALSDVLGLMGDADKGVRERAARTAAALVERSNDPAARALAAQALQTALKDGSFEVQQRAIEALGRTGDASVLPALRQAYGDGSGPNALEAAVAMQQLGDGTAFQREAVRLKGLFDGGGSPDEKREAIKLLAEHVPPQESRPVLERALRDPSERVRREAQKAIERSAR